MLDATAGGATPGQEIAERLRAGSLMPYLGPGLTELAAAPVPTTHEELAAYLGARVSLPRRARGNCWAAAQYIETHRHRSTLDGLMNEAYAPPVVPTVLHRVLAKAAPPLIVDTWYDSAMRSALSGQVDWGEIQGTSRARIGEQRWYSAWNAAGEECTVAEAEAWRTLLYKPHGAPAPGRNVLVADADYVEVMTEIDIQTPLPDEVKRRRAGGGFLFLGCRFNDQMLRAYARQIMKRSGGFHIALVGGLALTRNERRFLEEMEVRVLDMDLLALTRILASG